MKYIGVVPSEDLRYNGRIVSSGKRVYVPLHIGKEWIESGKAGGDLNAQIESDIIMDTICDMLADIDVARDDLNLQRGICTNLQSSNNNIENIVFNKLSSVSFSDWELGTFTATGVPDTRNDRIRSAEYHKLPYRYFTFKPNPGYKIGVYMYLYNAATDTYTLDNKISQTTAETTFVVQDNYFYKFLASYANDAKIVDIADVYNNIVFVGDVGKRDVGCSFNHAVSDTCDDKSSSSDTPLANMSSADIYSLFEALRTTYPRYVSRALLGYCSDANNSPDNTRPVYEYIINPYNGAQTTSGLLRSVPTVCVVCGIHGNEKASVWAVYQMLLQAFTGHTGFSQIIANCKLKIIPVLNRYGFDNNIRGCAQLDSESANIDINRTFADQSTLEAVLLSNWQKTNKNCYAYIDFHNTANNGWYTYLTTSNRDLKFAYSSMIRTFAPIWQGKHGFDVWHQEEVETRFVFTKEPVSTGGTYYALNTAGIRNAATLEAGNYDQVSGEIYTSTAIEVAVDLIANWILSLLRKYYIY